MFVNHGLNLWFLRLEQRGGEGVSVILGYISHRRGDFKKFAGKKMSFHILASSSKCRIMCVDIDITSHMFINLIC